MWGMPYFSDNAFAQVPLPTLGGPISTSFAVLIHHLYYQRLYIIILLTGFISTETTVSEARIEVNYNKQNDTPKLNKGFMNVR